MQCFAYIAIIYSTNQEQLPNGDTMFNKARILELFISYRNDFISTNAFAEYYQLTIAQAESVITRGRILAYSAYPEMRGFFTRNQLPLNQLSKSSEKNALFFRGKYEARLLSEHSA